MLPVSDLFKEKINADSRWIKGLVIIDFAKPIDYPFCTVTATSTLANYSASQACDGRVKQTEYSLQGQNLPSPLNQPKIGWRSAAKSDSNGVFTTPQVITISYTNPIPARNYWLLSDRFNFPVDFQIDISTDGSTWIPIIHETGNDSDYFFINSDGVLQIYKARITINKISAPNSEAFVLECGAVSTVVFEDDDIVDLELLEEMQTDAFSLNGGVTSNQFDLTIRNDRMQFLTATTDSPFYKLLRPEIRFRPYLGVRTVAGDGSSTLDEFEMVPLGIFYLTEWKASTGSLEASMSGSDLMYLISQKESPKIRAREYVTVKTLFRDVFAEMGLTDDDYIIEAGVPSPILKIGWVPKGDYIDALMALAGASNSNVYIDRLGKLRVSSKFTEADSVDVWTDDNQILFTDNPLRFNDTYSKVEYTWYKPKKNKEIEEVLSYELTLNPFETKTQELELKGPLLQLIDMAVTDCVGVEISNIEYGSFYCKFTLYNNNANEQTFTVKANGITVSTTQSITLLDSANTDFNKTLKVENELVQETGTAQSYGRDILKVASDPLSKIEISVKGNPAIELKDVILMDDKTNRINNSKIFLYYHKLTYSGGLEAEVKCIKQVVPTTVAFTGMGMPIAIKRRFV